jgi:mono/diheme cytochrome c family protein
MNRMLLAIALLAGCAEDRNATVAGLTGDSANGATVYADNCASCHAADGTGGGAYPNLVEEAPSQDEVIDYVINGEGEMPAFGDSLSDQDVADVTTYVLSLAG